MLNKKKEKQSGSAGSLCGTTSDRFFITVVVGFVFNWCPRTSKWNERASSLCKTEFDEQSQANLDKVW